MLGDHLELMVRGRMWLVMVAVVMIAIIRRGIVIVVMRGDGMNVIEVGLRKKMAVEVIDVNDEQNRREQTQPPGSRSGLRHRCAWLTFHSHQLRFAR